MRTHKAYTPCSWQRGFSLPELMIVLAVAAILATIAEPAFYKMLQNNRLASITSSFAASINYARMEGIRQGIKISICPAADATLSACGSATQWTKGWIVFTDADNNNQVDAAGNVIKAYSAMPSGIAATANGAIISFDSSGFLASSPFSMSLSASQCYGKNARQVSVTTSGRLSVTRVDC